MPADLARDGATGVRPANRYMGSNVGPAGREVPQGIAEADIPGIDTVVVATASVLLRPFPGNKVGGQFEVGRPPGTPPGTPQRSQIAVEMGVEFKELGTYMISASIDDEEPRTFPFNVIPGPGLAAQLQKEQPPEGTGPHI